MEQDQRSREEASLPPKPLKKSVLLLDGEAERQLKRATAMRERGVIVDAVATVAEARSLWKPRSYHLVMIELSGAHEDADEFYRHVLDREPNQRFAFYSNIPPYLTAAPPKNGRTSVATSDSRPPSPLGSLMTVREGNAPTAPRTGVWRAASSRSDTSFSDAVKNAERDLRERF